VDRRSLAEHGSRAAVLRRREQRRSFSASDDEVGGTKRDARPDVRAADLQEKPTKRVENNS
jgi:hypothetical protein